MPPHDFGAVAAVDGRTVNVTPFRTANIPPPMAMFSIEASHTVIDVAFSQDNSFMAVLHHGGLDLFEWQTRNKRSLAPRLLAAYDFKSDGLVHNALQVSVSHYGQADILYFNSGLKICTGRLNDKTGSVIVKEPVLLEEEAIFLQADSITRTPGQDSIADAYFQTKTGRLVRLSSQDGSFEALTTGFPLQLPWVETVEIEDYTLAFGLSRSGHLYANSRQLVKNCTSFLVTSDHLIFTTSNHFLKFVHLARPEGMLHPVQRLAHHH